MSDVAEAFRELSALLAAAVERVARQLLAPHARVGVRQPPVLGEPRVDVDDASDAPGAVVGDEHQVRFRPQRLPDGTDGLVEVPIDRGHAALGTPLFPLEPAVVLHVVGSHEDDEQ